MSFRSRLAGEESRSALRWKGAQGDHEVGGRKNQSEIPLPQGGIGMTAGGLATDH
jgi:hypothetical protein